MITEHDLQEAIAECQGQRNPNASTCIKLAAFYTIKEHLFPNDKSIGEEPKYSFDPPPLNDESVHYSGDSEFARTVTGRNINDVMLVVDEAMSALSVINPKFYASIMRKFEY